MNLYREIVLLGCCSRNDFVRICGSESSADWHIRDYLKKGYIERIRRDLYAVISLETSQAIPSRFQIASKVADDACIMCHSAFEYYGYGNQVFYDVFFSSIKRVRPFSYDGLNYVHISSDINRSTLYDSDSGIRVTSIEQTVIDSIEYMEKVGGYEELIRCLMLVPSLNEATLLGALSHYGKGNLYQKTGYILELLKQELSLSEDFFTECENHISAGKVYIFPKQDGFIYHDRWKLYAPANLDSFLNKGADVDAGI